MESSSLKALACQQLRESASNNCSSVALDNGSLKLVASSTVFVTGLDLTCTDEDLKDCFLKYMPPQDIDQLIVSSNLPFLGPGFALVGLGSPEAAGRAVADSESLDGGLFIGSERITAVPSSTKLCKGTVPASAAAAAAATSMPDAAAVAMDTATFAAAGTAASDAAAAATAMPVPRPLAPTASLVQRAPKHVRVLW